MSEISAYPLTWPHVNDDMEQLHSCTKCNISLPISLFKISLKTGKPSSVCNCCERKQTAARNVRYRAKNKDDINKRLSERRKRFHGL
jgi:hypothetical protein